MSVVLDLRQKWRSHSVLLSLPHFRVSLLALTRPEPLPLGLCLPAQPIVTLEGLPTFSVVGGQLCPSGVYRSYPRWPASGSQTCSSHPKPWREAVSPCSAPSASARPDGMPPSLRNAPCRARNLGRRTSGAFPRPVVCEGQREGARSRLGTRPRLLPIRVEPHSVGQVVNGRKLPSPAPRDNRKGTHVPGMSS